MASQLTDAIRKKFPGQYDDMDDTTLEAAILAKHPEYKDLAVPVDKPVETPVEKPAVIEPAKKPAEPEFSGSPMFSKGFGSDAEPSHEPDTYFGGYLKGLGDYIKGISSGIMPALESAAHPRTLGDILSLVIPSELPPIAKGQLGKIGSRIASEEPIAQEAISAAPKIAQDIPLAPKPLQTPAEVFDPSSLGFNKAKFSDDIKPQDFDEIGTQQMMSAQDKAVQIANSSEKTGTMTTKELMKLAEPGNVSSIAKNERAGLDKLKADIQKNGIKQPIDVVLSRNGSGEFVLDDGHHRLAAARELGINDIPVRIRRDIPESINVTKASPYNRMYDPKTGKRIIQAPDEVSQLVKNAGLEEPKTPIEVVGQEKPNAKFLGLQQNGDPLFNISGGPNDRSTVGLDKLKELGIEAPDIPSDAKPVRGDDLRRLAMQKSRSATMDAKSKGFRGTANDMSEGPRQFATQSNQPPKIDPSQVPEELNKINQTAKMATESQKKSLWGQFRDAERAILTSYDFSAPGRQGFGLVTHPEYFTSLDDMVKAWGSGRASQAIDEAIVNHPSGLFKPEIKLKSGKLVSKADLAGLDLNVKGEQFQSGIAEKYAPGVERSERAYNAYLKKLKSDVFAKLVKQAGAENNIPDMKSIANSINVSTGRGSFGKLEQSATAMKALNEIFFAPKLAASRVQMYTRVFNPNTYINTPMPVRVEALRSLLGITGTSYLIGQLSKAAGAEVHYNPFSSDFGKVKIGNTRFDTAAGLQQYAVGVSKILGHTQYSTTSGKMTDLNSGKFGMPTKWDVAQNLAASKLAPVPSLIYSWMRGKEFDGMPFEVKNAIIQRVAPIVAQDLYDLYKSDPNLFPPGFMKNNPTITKGLMAIPPILGVGSQTYGR